MTCLVLWTGAECKDTMWKLYVRESDSEAVYLMRGAVFFSRY